MICTRTRPGCTRADTHPSYEFLKWIVAFQVDQLLNVILTFSSRDAQVGESGAVRSERERKGRANFCHQPRDSQMINYQCNEHHTKPSSHVLFPWLNCRVDVFQARNLRIRTLAPAARWCVKNVEKCKLMKHWDTIISNISIQVTACPCTREPVGKALGDETHAIVTRPKNNETMNRC